MLPDADAEHQDHLFRIRKDGYIILRGVWDAGTCAAARARLDEMHRELEPDAAVADTLLCGWGDGDDPLWPPLKMLRLHWAMLCRNKSSTCSSDPAII